MYKSKTQVKNLVSKSFGKYSVSKTIKGRVCDSATDGYTFQEKENGFIQVSYFDNNSWKASYKEAYKLLKETKMDSVKALLTEAGFDFDGIDGFRKKI